MIGRLLSAVAFLALIAFDWVVGVCLGRETQQALREQTLRGLDEDTP